LKTAPGFQKLKNQHLHLFFDTLDLLTEIFSLLNAYFHQQMKEYLCKKAFFLLSNQYSKGFLNFVF